MVAFRETKVKDQVLGKMECQKDLISNGEKRQISAISYFLLDYKTDSLTRKLEK